MDIWIKKLVESVFEKIIVIFKIFEKNERERNRKK